MTTGIETDVRRVKDDDKTPPASEAERGSAAIGRRLRRAQAIAVRGLLGGLREVSRLDVEHPDAHGPDNEADTNRDEPDTEERVLSLEELADAIPPPDYGVVGSSLSDTPSPEVVVTAVQTALFRARWQLESIKDALTSLEPDFDWQTDDLSCVCKAAEAELAELRAGLEAISTLITGYLHAVGGSRLVSLDDRAFELAQGLTKHVWRGQRAEAIVNAAIRHLGAAPNADAIIAACEAERQDRCGCENRRTWPFTRFDGTPWSEEPKSAGGDSVERAEAPNGQVRAIIKDEITKYRARKGQAVIDAGDTAAIGGEGDSEHRAAPGDRYLAAMSGGLPDSGDVAECLWLRLLPGTGEGDSLHTVKLIGDIDAIAAGMDELSRRFTGGYLASLAAEDGA